MDRNDGGRFYAGVMSSKVEGNLDGNRGMVDWMDGVKSALDLDG